MKVNTPEQYRFPVSYAHGRFHCDLCGLDEKWSSFRAAKLASLWHIWEKHFELWIQHRRYDLSAKAPRPDAIGSRL